MGLYGVNDCQQIMGVVGRWFGFVTSCCWMNFYVVNNSMVMFFNSNNIIYHFHSQ